jgi:hypothetical protein
MQASGVYSIGLYPILEKHGLEVRGDQSALYPEVARAQE